jgi:hypothetical protein
MNPTGSDDKPTPDPPAQTEQSQPAPVTPPQEPAPAPPDSAPAEATSAEPGQTPAAPAPAPDRPLFESQSVADSTQSADPEPDWWPPNRPRRSPPPESTSTSPALRACLIILGILFLLPFALVLFLWIVCSLQS